MRTSRCTPVFGTQEAVRVVAFDLDRRVLDAGDVAFGLLEHFGLEALALAITQILAQQHRRPVARLGAAGAGLDVEKGVVGIGRVREHPAEFHVGDACLDGLGVTLAGEQRVVVGFFACHLEQVLRVAHVVRDRRELADRVVEQLLFLTERLGVLRVVPDVRVFEFPVDFD
ncbi:hypothetical protein OKW35_007073 [Paraburkholderia sp. MM5477-R1]